MNYINFLVWLTNYLGKFIPNFRAYHSTTSPREKVFELKKPRLESTESVKTLVTSEPCLKTFVSQLPARLRTYAISTGLDAFLEQN